MTPARFQVDDMNCNHCVAAITKALETNLPGTTFTVDLPTRQVAVAAAPEVAEAILQDAGFEPVRLSD